MKKLLLGALALFSMNAFSQSYIILNSGVALTTDTKGFVYDFKHFVLPNKVKGNGGNFLIEDKQLVTIDENGFLYKKDTNVKKLKGSGLNYFISEGGFGSRKLYTVDAQGFAYELTPEGMKLKDVKKFGGNYFILDNTMTIVRKDGTYKTVRLEGLNLDAIKNFPGKYFISSAGQFFTVTDEGLVRTENVNFVNIRTAGGNFFVDEFGVFRTLDSEGALRIPALPKNFKVNSIRSVGANYVIDNAANVFTVDADGNVNQRFIDLDVSRAKVLGL